MVGAQAPVESLGYAHNVLWVSGVGVAPLRLKPLSPSPNPTNPTPEPESPIPMRLMRPRSVSGFPDRSLTRHHNPTLDPLSMSGL
jgi:hypothetical protein